MRYGLMGILLFAACAPDGAESRSDAPKECEGVIVEVDGLGYCFTPKRADDDDDEGPACPRSHPERRTNNWSVVICGPKNANARIPALYAAYDEQECLPNAATCGSHAKCEYVSQSWIVEDGVCVASPEGVCAAMFGGLGDAEDCLERDLGDGRTQAFMTGSIWVEAAWETNSGLCDLCRAAEFADMGVPD